MVPRRHASENDRLLKRIIQSEDDLWHASECATPILERGLHDATERFEQRLLRCLNTALIVSYARPFSGNRASRDVQKSMPREFLDALTPDELALHCQLVRARNEDHAHSDPSSRQVLITELKVGDKSVMQPILRDASAPLPRQRTEDVAMLIAKVLSRLAAERERLWRGRSGGAA